MMYAPIKVIVAEDDSDSRDLILHQLNDERFDVTLKDNCEEVLSDLSDNSDNHDVVLLDYHFNGGMNGLDCLKKMKAKRELRDLPVILQTVEKDSERIIEALNEGAFYFLEKTTQRQIIRSVVLSAMESRIRYSNLVLQRQKLTDSLKFIEEARFKITTLDDMDCLTALLASAYPDPERVTIGIHELLTNAIEHGNLGIDYTTKSKLITENTWKSEIDKRLEMKEYQGKSVEIHIKKTKDKIILTIKDQGSGFRFQEFLDFDTNRLFEAHGRGIAVARHMAFDTVEYLGNGNKVKTTFLLNS